VHHISRETECTKPMHAVAGIIFARRTLFPHRPRDDAFVNQYINLVIHILFLMYIEYNLNMTLKLGLSFAFGKTLRVKMGGDTSTISKICITLRKVEMLCHFLGMQSSKENYFSRTILCHTSLIVLACTHARMYMHTKDTFFFYH